VGESSVTAGTVRIGEGLLGLAGWLGVAGWFGIAAGTWIVPELQADTNKMGSIILKNQRIISRKDL
jgi:hypothetical protein